MEILAHVCVNMLNFFENQKYSKYSKYLRHDRGYPQVYFAVPLPVPVNTVPVRLQVRFYWGYGGVWLTTHGYSRVFGWGPHN